MQIRQKTADNKIECPWYADFRAPQLAGKPLRVLIADDEPFARAALSMLLKGESDFTIVGSVADGTETLGALRRLCPDVLFLDVDMPGLDGFEVLEQSGRPRNLAIIFTTSHEKWGARAFEFNALDYLLKPFSRARFKVALERARDRFSSTRLPPCVIGSTSN